MGDKTEWYSVLKTERKGKQIIAEVRFTDGGTGQRIWDDPNTLIQVVA